MLGISPQHPSDLRVACRRRAHLAAESTPGAALSSHLFGRKAPDDVARDMSHDCTRISRYAANIVMRPTRSPSSGSAPKLIRHRPSPRTGRRSTQALLRGRTSLDGDLTGSAGSPRRRARPSPTTSEGAAESVVLRDAECVLSPMRSRCRTAERSLQICGSRVLGR